jgi:hypothetical protein
MFINLANLVENAPKVNGDFRSTIQNYSEFIEAAKRPPRELLSIDFAPAEDYNPSKYLTLEGDAHARTGRKSFG